MAANFPPTMSAVDAAWQSVSLEERLELISRAQASGISASIAATLLIGCVAYGVDKIWLLAAGAASSLFFYPLFSSYCWRRGKPNLILAYLAVKAVARRYAYSFNIKDLDIVLIYRGRIKELFKSEEQKEWVRQHTATVSDDNLGDTKEAWIVLMRDAVVILSEKLGGAKLEFITHITYETSVIEAGAEHNAPKGTLLLEGVGASKGRRILLSSRYTGAQFVFTKNLQSLIQEEVLAEETKERLRQQTASGM